MSAVQSSENVLVREQPKRNRFGFLRQTSAGRLRKLLLINYLCWPIFVPALLCTDLSAMRISESVFRNLLTRLSD